MLQCARSVNNGEILIVDDDPGVRTFLCTLLERLSYKVEIAENGTIAVDRIRRKCYDAILLDLMLPNLNGFEIIRLVKSDRPHLAKRIIVMTAAFERTLRHFSDESAIWALVRKPFDIHELLALVAGCTSQNGHSKSDA